MPPFFIGRLLKNALPTGRQHLRVALVKRSGLEVLFKIA